MTPLEQATQAATAELNRLKDEVRVTQQERRTAEERENILKGRVEALEKELVEVRARSDHNLQWACEVTKAIHDIGMFTADAMNLARQEVQAHKGNGRAIEIAEKAIGDAIQRKDDPPRLPNNQVR